MLQHVSLLQILTNKSYMKKSILLLLISIFTISLSASNTDPLEKIMLTGKVIDNDTKQPLEYATIVIKSLDGKIITGGITDTKGEFSIQVVKGVYDISVEGVSLISNYRTTFATEVKQDGLDALITRLQKHNKKTEA